MASLTQWTWVWANSGRWWRTGRPGVPQSMRSQRIMTVAMLVNGHFRMKGALQHLKIMDFISQSGFVFVYFSTKVDAHTSPPPWDGHLWPHLLCISQYIPDPHVTLCNMSCTAQFNVLKSSMSVLCKSDYLKLWDYVLTYSCFISQYLRKNRNKKSTLFRRYF